MMVKGRPCVPCVPVEMEFSNKKGLPRVNLGFNEPWTRDVFALGFDKPVELRRGLPMIDFRFDDPMRLTKCRAWVR